MRIAFYVSGRASRLKKIIKDKRFKYIKKTIKLIFTDNFLNENLSEISRTEKITVKGIQYEHLDSRLKKKNYQLSQMILDEFIAKEIDYCFSFGDHILKSNLLRVYKNKIINFHPSLLPMFPGRKSIDQAIANNSFLLGNSAHFIDEGIDTGPVIMQNIVHHSQFANEQKYDIILDCQVNMFYQIFKWLEEDRIIIEKGRCKIQNGKTAKVVYYPELEI